MSRDFNNSYTNSLSKATSLISNVDCRPCSLHLWLEADSNGATHALFNNNSNNSPRFYFSIRSGDVQSIYSGGFTNSNTFTLSTTDWSAHGFSWDDADNSYVFYHNGAANGSGTKTIGGIGITGCYIGTLDGSTGFYDVDGRIAEFGFWNAILTAAEFAALGNGVSPRLIRPGNLVSYVPIFGNDSPEVDLVDATRWTVNGSPSKAVHPRVIYPSRRRVWMPSSAAPPLSTWPHGPLGHPLQGALGGPI